MKHTELRAAVLDALEKHDTGATFFDGRPAVFDEADFPAVAVYLTGAEYTGEELDSDTWQAELHIEVFLPAQVPDSELDAWMESRIYPVMTDIPALSDLITSMVASGYDYRRDDDAGLWSSADMPVPNPVMPVKGAGTTLWVYKGNGDPYANPLSDVDWSRLAKVKDLTPGELTAESYDDSYLDDENADWAATGQGQKSAGDTSFTLAWMPGEQGQQALLAWFNEGDTRAYKIRFPNGTVDVFRGWVSSIGKAVTAKEVITRTVKVTNVGRPSMAEDRSTVTAATGMTVTPASTSVVKGRSTTLTVAFQPEGATDKSFRAVSADKTKATVSVSGMTITVKGVAAGKVNIPVVSGNGELAAVAEITVTAS